jgi:K+-transporting ATPase ATPase B chain
LPKPEESLLKNTEETPQDKFYNGEIKNISSSELKKGDVLFCDGDLMQTDGEIIRIGHTIDESAITGESAPVIQGSGWR